MTTTPLDLYRDWVNTGKLEANSEQEAVLHYLTQVSVDLVRRQNSRYRVLARLTQYFQLASPPIGLYLWGNVGAGKTLLMNFFYETLVVPKLRLHFHAFMQRLHQELREWQGHTNPLESIAERLAAQYAVICFDEFLVTNVADAILLAELFKALFQKGICLVTTANLPPERLYENGLQRQRFLPVIDLIQRHTRIWHLSVICDYRRQIQEQLAAYYTPWGDESERALAQVFQTLEHRWISSAPLILFGREITVKQRSDRAIWFEFTVICGKPRSSVDYLALTNQYSAVLVSHVPCLDTVSKDAVVSFMNLIDILYDAKKQLFLSAAVPIEKLYTRSAFRQTFERTQSRLFELLRGAGH